ncbi:hypothetical protein PPERSA_05277 [Pseudocohnilembus persalinus]|uniref:Proteasome subunit beta n=1 Tax=Pseudocohnilembus persalinus TaxID=266149 RepID=A0A0V0R5U8_PSEPJ|nr:hypothetical protein PPERSA_05277 [Pseudocohnilembus persalinus]|eukprot:KRX09885.1 hypothetical protein PPERSA_05277 [Pseudocohnilembus persalinus]
MENILAQQSFDNKNHLNHKTVTLEESIKEHRQPQWNPYCNNEGTICAIGGKGFLIIGADTRLSSGYSIVSRNSSKIQKLTNDTYLATSGMHADFKALCQNLDVRLKMYEFDNGRAPSTKSCASLLARTLYQKRFFPYYTFNALCGFDSEGNGTTYGYDAVGSYDTKSYVVLGSASQLIIPVLDCQIESYNKLNSTFEKSKEQVEKLIIDVFNSATERDIYTGDSLELIIIEQGKEPQTKIVKLRHD